MATIDDDGSTVPRRAGLGAAEEPIMAHRDSTPRRAHAGNVP